MSDAFINKDNMPTGERVLPDRDICHVRPIGTIHEFANCMVERPIECPYVLYFGEGNICRNPQWKEFIVRRDPGIGEAATQDT